MRWLVAALLLLAILLATTSDAQVWQSIPGGTPGLSGCAQGQLLFGANSCNTAYAVAM